MHRFLIVKNYVFSETKAVKTTYSKNLSIMPAYARRLNAK